MNIEEYRDLVLKTILEHEKEYDQVEQNEVTTAIGWLYEKIRSINTD